MAKRGQGEGSISKRDDGTWWARITIGKDENGKQKRKAFYGKTRKEVQEKLTAALNELNNDTYIEPSKILLSDWMDMWIKEYKRYSVKPKTYLSYCSMINCHIKPKLCDYRLKELRSDIVQKFVNRLIDDGLKASTIEDVYRLLKSSLEQAVDNELINKNPALKVKLPKKSKEEAKVLSIEEQMKFIELAKTYFHGEAFILILATGLRIGETLALTWDDIDFENRILRVNKTQIEYIDVYNKESKFHIETGTPKTKSSFRNIPLLPVAIQLLKNVRKKQNEQKRELGKCFQDNNLIFCTFEGKPIYSNDMRNKFNAIKRKLGIDGIHIHSLRHTFATRGLENGIELKVMQELLGHANISMTADIYSHVLPDKKKDSIMKLKDTISL